MPVIRIEVPERTDQDTKRRIRKGVKQAVLDTLAPKETKYDYVAIREAFADTLQTELGSDPADLSVLFRETPAANHYTGRAPLTDWTPADS